MYQLSPLETAIMIPGPIGLLEAIIAAPKEQERGITAVICHPHPLYGGAMGNKVVTTLFRAFQSSGLHAVRFNFRGVGASTGEYDNGIGESADCVAVLQWVQAQRPNDAIVLAGFSFGSYVAARVAAEFPTCLLITVAPPVHHFDFTPITMPDCPWYVIQGDQDEVVAPSEVYAWVKQLSPAPTLIVMPKATHFFHGHLTELRQRVEQVVADSCKLG
ncbi:Dot/Icm type IV secretion system effector CoxH3 [soil metagenome]